MRNRDRASSLVAVACIVASSCGGPAADRDDSSASPPDSEVEVNAAVVTAPPTTDDEPESDGSVASEAAGTPADEPAVRRELGLTLRPESDVSTNPLPPVEVHDVGQDRMVNFKNIFPAERPVLLWMWAPY